MKKVTAFFSGLALGCGIVAVVIALLVTMIEAAQGQELAPYDPQTPQVINEMRLEDTTFNTRTDWVVDYYQDECMQSYEYMLLLLRKEVTSYLSVKDEELRSHVMYPSLLHTVDLVRMSWEMCQ